MNLRVLHIHRGIDHRGGNGAVAMYRLHRRLLEQGVDSKILVLPPVANSPDVSRLPSIERLSMEARVRWITRRIGLNDIHRLGSFLVDRHTFFQNADVIHFHCMHSGAFSYLALPRVARTKPCVFSMHDMWALTGHCGYSYECARWKTGCGDCPYPGESPAIRRDATRLEWRLKKRAFAKAAPHLVTKSGWSTRMIGVSALRHLPVTEIPYGVDSDVFQPLGKAPSRTVLGLPEDQHVLLFSAKHLSRRRTGADLLVRALVELPADLAKRTLLLTMGKRGAEIGQETGLPVRDLGHVADNRLRAVAYSAADLFLFPTRADVFGLASIESQACGTPVVSFRVGGVPDHVRPGVTGFLAEPEDALGFRDGIALLLESQSARDHLSESCREIAVSEYDLTIETRRHVELYDTVLRERGSGPSTDAVVVPPLPGEAVTVSSAGEQDRPVAPVARGAEVE